MILLFSFVGRINHIIDSGMVDHPLIFSLAQNIQLGLPPRRIFLVSSEYQRIIDHPLIDYLINNDNGIRQWGCNVLRPKITSNQWFNGIIHWIRQ